jgi:hypothetical protein
LSHLYDGARRGYIAVHHRGVCGSEGDAASLDCWSRISCGSYSWFYDFCISRNGTINTSWDSACLSYPFYRNSTGGATCGCNCAPFTGFTGVTAVMMQRCYGGSGCNSPCPLTGFTDPQLCGLAYLSFHLGAGAPTPNEYNHISHLKAGSWAPCGGGCSTQCCGTNLAQTGSSSGWTIEGLYEINRMLWMRNNLASGYDCLGQIHQ